MSTPTFNPWKDRIYLNDWFEAAGVEVTRYNTGNVSSFYINGRKVANGRFGSLRTIKVWFKPEDGKVKVQYNDGRAVESAYLVEKLQPYVDEYLASKED